MYAPTDRLPRSVQAVFRNDTIGAFFFFRHLLNNVIDRIPNTHRLSGRIPAPKEPVDYAFINDNRFTEQLPERLSHLLFSPQAVKDL